MDDNVYDDLIGTDLGENILALENTNQALWSHIRKLEADVAKLCTEITNMKQVQVNLTRNISELFKTAKGEIARKDRMIAELRRELDDLLFKRHNRDHSHNLETLKRERNLDHDMSDLQHKKPRTDAIEGVVNSDHLSYNRRESRSDSNSHLLKHNNSNRHKDINRNRSRRRSRSRSQGSSRSRKSESRNSADRHSRKRSTSRHRGFYNGSKSSKIQNIPQEKFTSIKDMQADNVRKKKQGSFEINDPKASTSTQPTINSSLPETTNFSKQAGEHFRNVYHERQISASTKNYKQHTTEHKGEMHHMEVQQKMVRLTNHSDNGFVLSMNKAGASAEVINTTHDIEVTREEKTFVNDSKCISNFAVPDISTNRERGKGMDMDTKSLKNEIPVTNNLISGNKDVQNSAEIGRGNNSSKMNISYNGDSTLSSDTSVNSSVKKQVRRRRCVIQIT